MSDFRHDTLGFSPYVQAVRQFLLNRQTETPLCMSVEGDWGSGKSSFLKQLARAIKAAGVKTVFFEAWRHNDDESLAASFALECARQLKPANPFKRVYPAIKLWAKRIDWRLLPVILRVIVRLGVFVFLTCALLLFLFHGPISHTGLFAEVKQLKLNLDHNLDPVRKKLSLPGAGAEASITDLLLGFGGIAGYVVVLILLLKGVRALVGDPFDFDLSKLAADPSYKTRVGFAEDLYRDLARVVAAYTGGKRFVAFIDDLDRCDATTTAELMQAISLVASLQDGKPMFVIAMDRDRVAAALAVRNKDQIPYLTFQGDEPSERTLTQRALDYGFAFMEKVVQVAFRVPRPSSYELWDMAKGEVGPAHLGRFEELSGEDSRRVQTFVNAVSFVFGHNPRRLKQFMNLYRLNILIAAAVQVMDDMNNLDIKENYNEPGSVFPEMRQLTVEKLGKFLALTLACPQFVKAMSKDRDLLPELQKWALDRSHECKSASNAVEWQHDARLVDLLALNESEFYSSGNIPDSEKRAAIFSLEDVDLHALLRLAPPPGFAPPPPPPPLPHPESELIVSSFAATGTHALLGTRANGDRLLQLIAPIKSGGLAHFMFEADRAPGRWKAHKLLLKDAQFDSVSLMESDYADASRANNLELVARTVEHHQVAFFWRYGSANAEWRGPYFLPITARKQPLLFQGRRYDVAGAEPVEPEGDFSLFVPTSRGLKTYWRDNSDFQRQWKPPTKDDITASGSVRPLAAFEDFALERNSLSLVFLDRNVVKLATCEDGKNWSESKEIVPDACECTAAICIGTARLEMIEVFILQDGQLRHIKYDPRGPLTPERVLFLPSAKGAQAIAASKRHDGVLDIVVRVDSKLLHFSWTLGQTLTGPIEVAGSSLLERHAVSIPNG